MASPFGRMVVICNRRAGGGGAGRALPEVRRHLDERRLEYDIRWTERRGHATELARAALEEGCRFLVAAGGDGTVHEVLNGMIEDDEAVEPEAVLGVVAAGTGCDFVKTFGIPALPGHAVVHLDGPESFRIDIGKVTYLDGGVQTARYFCNVAEAGRGARVVARAGRLPRALGALRYPFAFWLTLPGDRPAEAVVDLVDRTYEGRMSNLVVANGQFFGAGMKIAPRAAPTDGLLDIQIERARRREAIALFPRVYRGQHVPHPDIVEAKRARLSVSADRALPLEADGELLGRTPASFEVLPGPIALKV